MKEQAMKEQTMKEQTMAVYRDKDNKQVVSVSDIPEKEYYVDVEYYDEFNASDRTFYTTIESALAFMKQFLPDVHPWFLERSLNQYCSRLIPGINLFDVWIVQRLTSALVISYLDSKDKDLNEHKVMTELQNVRRKFYKHHTQPKTSGIIDLQEVKSVLLDNFSKNFPLAERFVDMNITTFLNFYAPGYCHDRKDKDKFKFKKEWVSNFITDVLNVRKLAELSHLDKPNDSFSLDQEFEKKFELFVRGKLLHHSDAISYDSLSLSDLAVNKEVIQEGQYNFEKEISEVDKILQPTEGKN